MAAMTRFFSLPTFLPLSPTTRMMAFAVDLPSSPAISLHAFSIPPISSPSAQSISTSLDGRKCARPPFRAQLSPSQNPLLYLPPSSNTALALPSEQQKRTASAALLSCLLDERIKQQTTPVCGQHHRPRGQDRWNSHSLISLSSSLQLTRRQATPLATCH